MGIKTNKGYDVTSVKVQSQQREVYRDEKGKRKTRNRLNAKSNGRLYEKGDNKANGPRLWVYEWGTGFSLSGSTGQGISMRDFYPRNRIQQSITVICQCPDQQIYGDTIEWIRTQHRKRTSSTVLEIVGKTGPIKGPNQSLAAEGYVKTVVRSHERFVYAPELRFDFLVERIMKPSAWEDKLSDADRLLGPRSLPDWNTVFIENGKFRRNPDRRKAASPPTLGEVIEREAEDFPEDAFGQ